MNADTKEHAAETDASEAQFGLRALMGAMTLVAVFAGVAGFAIRRFPAESQSMVTAFWGAMLAALIAYLAWGFRRRKLAEQEAGPTLLQVDIGGEPSSPYWVGWYVLLAILIVVALYVISGMVADLPIAAGKGDWSYLLIFPALMIVSLMVMASDALWKRRLRFCEHGILWGLNLLPWSDLLDFYWTGFDNHRLNLRSVNDSRKQPWATVPISGERRAGVSALLDANLSRVPRLPASARWVGIGEVPLWVAISEKQFRRHFFFAAVGVVCTALLIFWGWFRHTGTREFEESVQCALLIVVCFATQLRRQFVRRSGCPVARVFARRDLLGFVGSMAMATGIYWAAASLTLSPDWLGYAAGIAYFYFAVTTASYYFLTQLDIRANGVTIPGAFFWSWRSVQVHHWSAVESGRLVLGRKWRRVTAFVPQEQRDTVDRVLREKLGMPQETTQPRKEAVEEVVA